MRQAGVVALAVAVLAAFAVAIADLRASDVIGIGPGSFGFEPRAEGLALLPPEASCQSRAAPSPVQCARRYAYGRDKTLTAWVSVRNEGRFAVTLDGVSQRWLDQFPSELLIRPVAQLDAGDPTRGWDPSRSAPFKPVLLNPGDQRAVGVQFRTTGDVAFACRMWKEGGAIGWEAIPLAWHWLFSEHEVESTFAAPIRLMAPTSTDCAE